MQTGLITGTYDVQGNQAIFMPGQPLKPGELVWATVTTGTTNNSNEALDTAQVWQFQAKPSPSSGEFTQIYSDTVADSERTHVAIGDLDGDGDLDIFAANGAIPAPNKVFLNDGFGQFSDSGQLLGDGRSEGLIMGDIDGDHDLDVIVSNDNDQHDNVIWLNDGQGNFTNSLSPLGNNASDDVILGDIDGDGDLDALLQEYKSPSYAYYVWKNNGSGIFSATNQPIGLTSGFWNYDADLGDIDLDGDLDVYVTSSVSDTVWLNNGQGIFIDSGQRIDRHTQVALGDLDGDGDLDAFVTRIGEFFNGDADEVWLNQGGSQGGTPGVFSNSNQAIGNDSSTFVVLGDVEGDGDLDALVTSRCCGGTALNKLWLNDGSGNFADSGQNAGSTSYTAAFGDVNGDGLLDFVTGNDYYSTANFEVWANSIDPNDIIGLTANNNGPTIVQNATVLSATISYGQGVSYTWDLGDGTIAAGAIVTHTYGTFGEYTAVVTATNAFHTRSTTTTVTVMPYRIYLPVIQSP
jgi:hypothetical protein